MKTNSDFEQSKMLAEFLPVESADLMFVHTTDLEGDEHYDIDFRNNQPLLEGDIPCWSLAALLSFIPKRIKEDYIFRIDVGVKDSSIWYDELNYGVKNDLPDITAFNLVDACYEMIVELNKRNLI